MKDVKITILDEDRAEIAYTGEVDADYLNWKENKIFSPGEELYLNRRITIFNELCDYYTEYSKIATRIKELEYRKRLLKSTMSELTIKSISVDFFDNNPRDNIKIDINKDTRESSKNTNRSKDIIEKTENIMDILIKDNYKQLEEIAEKIKALLKIEAKETMQ